MKQWKKTQFIAPQNVFWTLLTMCSDIFIYLCVSARHTITKIDKKMKKAILVSLFMLFGMTMAHAQDKQASIKFDKTTCSFGSFSEKEAIQKCTFVFTNTGTAPLVINQAVASCGCTVPTYTKTPVMPGEKGEIKVTYNGNGRFPGHFKKTITVRTNGDPEMTRLYIEGDMKDASEAGK